MSSLRAEYLAVLQTDQYGGPAAEGRRRRENCAAFVAAYDRKGWFGRFLDRSYANIPYLRWMAAQDDWHWTQKVLAERR